MTSVHTYGYELKQLLKLMLPILLTQFAQAGFGLIDTIMAGQISATDLAAIAVAVGIWLPLVLLCSGIVMATSPLIAQAKGANKLENIPTITHQALWLALAIGFIGMCVLHLMPLCFDLLKIPENLHAKAGLFLHSIAFGVPAFTLYTVLRCYSEALGHPRPVTVISLFALPLLIPLNYIFMYGWGAIPALGSAGCGIANAILQWLMLIVLVLYINKAKTYRDFRLFQSFEKINPVWLKRIAILGIPIGLAVFFEVAIFSAGALIISPLGDVVTAAHQIAISITSQLFMIPFSLALALTIRVGQYYGEQNWFAMQRVQKLGMFVATFFAGCTITFLWFGRAWIIHQYNKDPAVFEVAFGLLIYAIAYQLVDAWQVASAGCLRGMQDTQAPMWITLFAYWGIAFPIGVYLTRYLDYSATGVWVGLLTGLLIASILLVRRLIQMNRRFSQQTINHP